MTANATPGSSISHLVGSAAADLRSAGIELPRFEAEVLLCAAAGIRREEILAHPDRVLPGRAVAAFRRMVLRRAGHEPLAYITGRKEFMSLELEVSPDVLVPRPDSEVLVEQALEHLTRVTTTTPRPTVIDVGTGSGALALAIAANHPTAEVWGVDISPAAIGVARRNAVRLGLAERVRLVIGDLLSAPDLPAAGTADLVVANLPYVSSATLARLAPEVAIHEPKLALDGGADGLSLIRRLIPAASAALRPSGAIGLECDPAQCTLVFGMLEAAGYQSCAIGRDLAGRQRTVWGVWRG